MRRATESRRGFYTSKDQVISLKTCSVTVHFPEYQMREKATMLIRTANSFKSNLLVSRGSVSVNAKSLLGFLSMAPAVGEELTITADGPDEDEALEALCGML